MTLIGKTEKNLLKFIFFLLVILFLYEVTSRKSQIKPQENISIYPEIETPYFPKLESSKIKKIFDDNVSRLDEFEPTETTDCKEWSGQTIQHVEKFVFFFGFNRCGSTATGKIIDAHQHALIANELLLFDKLKNPNLEMVEATKMICETSRDQSNRLQNDRGYSYRMGVFHGRFRQPLKVIGLRKSLGTIDYMKQEPGAFHYAMNRLQDKWKLVGVMVVRNPFDMIATRCKEIGAVLNLKHPQNQKLIHITSANCSKTRPLIPNCPEFIRDSMANGTAVVSQNKDVRKSINHIENIANLSTQLISSKKYNLSVVTVQLEDLIENPRKHAEKICHLLEMSCDENYIRGVVSGVLDSPNPSRNGVKWTQSQIEKVNNIVTRFPSVFTMAQHARLEL